MGGSKFSMELSRRKGIPHEPAAYTLLGGHGQLAGMMVVHVDDMIWTGNQFIMGKMERICQKFKFGKLEEDVFRFCGEK